MDDVRVPVQGHGVLDALVHAVTVLEFRGGDAEFDGEIFSAALMDGVADGHGEAGAVLQTAAPAVRALIGPLREKLLRQPAVAAVDGDHAAARHLAVGGGGGVFLDGG